MFGFCCRRLQLLVPSCSTVSVHSSATHFQKASRLYSSLLSASKIDHEILKDRKDQSFAVSYFINTLGFSPEVALSASKKQRVRFRSPKQPDSVIRLLKDYGFSDTDVSQMVKKRPTLLLFSAEKTLVPKLEFFRSIGITGTDLNRLISGNPKFLTFSLENNLRPCYDIIKALPIPDTMAVLVLSKLFQGFTVSPQNLSNIAPNIAFLKAVQVPETSVNLCLSINLYAVSRETDKFKENVENVISMGIRPSAPTFMKALYVMCVLDELKWGRRVEIYKTTFNWSEDEFFLAFRRYPMFMSLSEKNVFSKMDFLVNRMCWKSGTVAIYPHVLTYSLEKWIIPRYLVLRVLLLKGLMNKEVFSLPGTLSSSKISFLDKFVIKYQKQLPELLDIFQGKMSLADLGFEETGGAT